MGDDKKEPNANFSLTRRGLFEIAGLAMAAAALPSKLALAADFYPDRATQETSSVMQPLSGYMSDARSRPLPEEVVEKTKQHVLDTLAAMISGSELPPGRAALEFAR